VSAPCSLKAAFLAACCVTLLTSASSMAQDSPDRDTSEISSYVLTESGMEKFAQATINLGPILDQLAGDCDDGASDQSLDGQTSFISAIPGAEAAIKSAGMPVREFVVFIWSTMQNGIAAWMLTQPDGKLPSGVSMANVDFYRAHEAELKRITQPLQSDNCEDDEQSSGDDQYTGDQGDAGEQDYAGEDDSGEEED